MQADCHSLDNGKRQRYLLLAVIVVTLLTGVICYPLVAGNWHNGRLGPAEAFRALSGAQQPGLRLQDFDFGLQKAGDLRAAALATFGEAWEPDSSPGGGQRASPAFASRLALLLHSLDGEVACRRDDTLAEDQGLLRSMRVLLAINLRNNEAVLPHIILQIWRLAALLPQGSLFVSVYESGSTDGTEMWLKKLKQLLSAFGVPNRIIAGGNVSTNGMPRIKALAAVRNAALEPLWSGGGGGDGRSPHRWPATHVAFMNDVWACAEDFVRLLYQDADMACGFDLYSTRPRVNRIFDFAVSHMKFYDTWVARDIGGTTVQRQPPYVEDKYSKKRLKLGLPIPVKSCWNGLAVFKAAPFSGGLRFRDSKEGECFSSECKLVCDDLIRLGHSNIVMDPGVRLAYNLADARIIYRPESVWQIGLTTWRDVKASPIDLSQAASSNSTACCTTQADLRNCPLVSL